jgi:hypothetical protein
VGFGSSFLLRASSFLLRAPPKPRSPTSALPGSTIRTRARSACRGRVVGSVPHCAAERRVGHETRCATVTAPLLILDNAFDVRMNSRLGCQSKIVREGVIELRISKEEPRRLLQRAPERAAAGVSCGLSAAAAGLRSLSRSNLMRTSSCACPPKFAGPAMVTGRGRAPCGGVSLGRVNAGRDSMVGMKFARTHAGTCFGRVPARVWLRANAP